MDRLSMSFVAEPQAVPAARNALSALDGLIDEDARGKLRLLVTELLTNAVVHGSKRPTDSITMRVSVAADTIRVRVRDRGPGLARKPKARRGQPRSEGWGLLLVDRLADRWGVVAEPNELWFELDLAHC
jgi:anti-sigma regulatory factor (Ser/Thr protein kinase)